MTNVDPDVRRRAVAVGWSQHTSDAETSGASTNSRWMEQGGIEQLLFGLGVQVQERGQAVLHGGETVDVAAVTLLDYGEEAPLLGTVVEGGLGDVHAVSPGRSPDANPSLDDKWCIAAPCGAATSRSMVRARERSVSRRRVLAVDAHGGGGKDLQPFGRDGLVTGFAHAVAGRAAGGGLQVLELALQCGGEGRLFVQEQADGGVVGVVAAGAEVGTQLRNGRQLVDEPPTDLRVAVGNGGGQGHGGGFGELGHRGLRSGYM